MTNMMISYIVIQRNLVGGTCVSGRYVYSQQFCPFYEQGKFQGDWEPDLMEIKESEQFKNYIEKRKKNDLKTAQQLIQKWTT